MWVWSDDHYKNPNHGWRSMKRGCLTSFSIKQLYIWLEVVELSFYHRAHTWINGEPTHGQHDPNSMAHISQYTPQMSQALKDHICTQLSLGHTIKHKAIWWAHVNAREAMTWNDFIRQQNIAYLTPSIR
jgi:hypothetical protein